MIDAAKLTATDPNTATLQAQTGVDCIAGYDQQAAAPKQ